jgi:hypothetical protein
MWPRESLSRIRETGRSIEKSLRLKTGNPKTDRGRFSLFREDARCAGLAAGKKRANKIHLINAVQDARARNHVSNCFSIASDHGSIFAINFCAGYIYGLPRHNEKAKCLRAWLSRGDQLTAFAEASSAFR